MLASARSGWFARTGPSSKPTTISGLPLVISIRDVSLTNCRGSIDSAMIRAAFRSIVWQSSGTEDSALGLFTRKLFSYLQTLHWFSNEIKPQNDLIHPTTRTPSNSRCRLDWISFLRRGHHTKPHSYPPSKSRRR